MGCVLDLEADMTAWKDLERKTARVLGGHRNSRGGDFGQSMADVEHPLLSVECKYRKTLPKFLREGIFQALERQGGILAKPKALVPFW